MEQKDFYKNEESWKAQWLKYGDENNKDDDTHPNNALNNDKIKSQNSWHPRENQRMF